MDIVDVVERHLVVPAVLLLAVLSSAGVFVVSAICVAGTSLLQAASRHEAINDNLWLRCDAAEDRKGLQG